MAAPPTPSDPTRPTPPPDPAATPGAAAPGSEQEAFSTILVSVVAVLVVVAAMTWGVLRVLELSTSKEMAQENQDVTVSLSNAISARICACVNYKGPESDRRYATSVEQTAATATQQPPCLQPPIVTASQDGWFTWLARLIYPDSYPKPTPWQSARQHLEQVNVPVYANFYGSVAALNHAIADERLQSIRAAEESSRKASVFQILIIGIGALTTMVVSLRSMDNVISASLSRSFSIAAILLSALGTGAASLNSFYAPREASVRQVRGLVQLKQLHQEIFIFLAAERCDVTLMGPLDTEQTMQADPRARRIRAWHGQLQQISSGADGTTLDGIDRRRSIDDNGNGSGPQGDDKKSIVAPAATPSPSR